MKVKIESTGFKHGADSYTRKGERERYKMADRIVKAVSWIITNAEIVAGVKNPVGDQAIFKITGTVKRSDSKEPQKGPFVWTPNKKSAGYTLDLSGFNKQTGKGTIKVNGEIGKNGRKGAKPLAGDALSKYADLA